jgi:energy-coupling factor transporter ATP-binding protein EcfA2
MEKLPIGVYDDPKNQRQALFELDLQKSNVVVFGAAMSGKTTFVKNLLIKMHERYTPKAENVYIIDFSGALLKYRDMDLIYACFDNSNEENIKRLFNKLEGVLTANTRILGGSNFQEYGGEDRPPHTTFIIENFNGFLSDRRYESYQEKLLKLCREGLSKGVTIIITAVDTMGGVHQYISGFGQKISFEMPSDKYAEIFGSRVNLPMALQGRGLTNIDNEIYEFHCFLPFKDEEKELPQYMEPIGEKAPKLVSFDGDLTADNFKRFSFGRQTIDEASWSAAAAIPVTVGLDYYDMKPVTIDLAKTSSIGIFGKRQSGKTNLLWLLVEKAIQLKNNEGLRFILFDDGRKQLSGIAGYLRAKGVEFKVINQIPEMKDYLFGEGYYRTEYDDIELKDNPFTVFVMQNKSLYSTKAIDFLERYFPEMQSESEGKWLFIYSDVKNISESTMRNSFSDSLSVAFLLDNIGEFVADRGAKTVFGAMDAKELKERFARIEKGDGYFYDIESDELLKLKFIYSDELKAKENTEVSNYGGK